MGHHYDRGTMLFNLRRFREGIAEFTAELGEDPRSIEAYGMRGMCHLKLRKLKECHRDIQEAISLDPNWSYSYYVLSIAALAQGRTGESVRRIEEALRLQKSPAYFHQLAVVEFGRERVGQALKATEAALALNPRDVDNLVLRAKLLSKTGKLDEARGLLETALAIEPERPGTHRELGSINLLRGSADQALGHLVEARRIDPVRYNERRLLASAYGRLQWPFNRLDAAAKWLMGRSVQQRWWLVCGTMSFLVLVLLVTAPDFDKFSWPAAVTFAVVANLLTLLGTYPSLAALAAVVTLRRELDLRWRDYFAGFSEIPTLLLAHGFATFAAGILTAVPSLYYLLFAMVVLHWDAVWLLLRMHFVIALLVLPIVGMMFLMLSAMGAISIPIDWPIVVGNWLLVLAISYILMSVRRIFFRKSLPSVNPDPIAS